MVSVMKLFLTRNSVAGLFSRLRVNAHKYSKAIFVQDSEKRSGMKSGPILCKPGQQEQK